MRNYLDTYPKVKNSEITYVEPSGQATNVPVADITNYMTVYHLDKEQLLDNGASKIVGGANRRWVVADKILTQSATMALNNVNIVGGMGIHVDKEGLSEDIEISLYSEEIVTTTESTQIIDGVKIFKDLQITGKSYNDGAMLSVGGLDGMIEEFFSKILSNLHIQNGYGIVTTTDQDGNVSLSVDTNYIKNNIITEKFFEDIIKEKVAKELSAHLTDILNTRAGG